VFGGGHVVLPLLGNVVDDGLLPARDFLAGYGAVQAMPGPVFTFAAFIGAANTSPLTGVTGALAATIAIFVPSFALIFALAPVWDRLRALPRAASALRGANASVVGLLGSVLYYPILASLSKSTSASASRSLAYALIAVWKFPPWVVVVTSAVLGAAAGGACIARESSVKMFAFLEGDHTFSLVYGLTTGAVCLALAIPLLYWALPGHQRSFFGVAVDPMRRLAVGYGIFCYGYGIHGHRLPAHPAWPLAFVHPAFFLVNARARRDPCTALSSR